jgi:hypothetical protein
LRRRPAATLAYWVVDPAARPADATVTAWELDAGGEYRCLAEVRGDEVFPASAPYAVPVVPSAFVR